MIQLQAQVHQRTGVWLMISDLWDRIGGMFDLDQLDSMVGPVCPSTRVFQFHFQFSSSKLSDSSAPRLNPSPIEGHYCGGLTTGTELLYFITLFTSTTLACTSTSQYPKTKLGILITTTHRFKSTVSHSFVWPFRTVRTIKISTMYQLGSFPFSLQPTLLAIRGGRMETEFIHS